jgi:hypothetical protein
MSTSYTLICQKWEESERGWGTRPDGYSLHLTNHDRVCYIQDYWSEMPDTAPEEYSRPDGTPYVVSVDQTTYEQVVSSGGSRRYCETAPSGGCDGWMPLRNGGCGHVT